MFWTLDADEGRLQDQQLSLKLASIPIGEIGFVLDKGIFVCFISFSKGGRHQEFRLTPGHVLICLIWKRLWCNL